MLQMFKYLKSYKRQVAIIIVLLVVQVYCDLSLPQYTSDIVDIGIQQGGIEDAVPNYVRGETLESLELFMTDSEQQLAKDNFRASQDQNYKSDTVYEFCGDNSEREQVSKALETPMVMVYMAEKSGKFDLAELKSAVAMGAITREELRASGEEYMGDYAQMSESLIKQAAVKFVGNEYEELNLDMDQIQMDYLWSVGLMMLLYTFIMIMAAIVAGYFASKVGASVGRDLRRGVFGRVMSFSNKEMDQFSTASLITRSTNDIQQVQMVIVMLLRVVLMAPIIGIGGCIKVAATRTGLGWIIAAAVGIILIIIGVLIVIAMPKFKKMQELIDRVNLVSREIISGITVIRAFSREGHEEKRFDYANKDLMSTQLFTNRTMSFMMPMMMLLMNGVTLVIVWFGAKGVDLGNLQVGDMMAFITYAMMIVMAFMMLTVMAIMLPRAGVAADRIKEVLSTETSVKDKEKTIKPENIKGRIEFKNVCFKYPNADDNAVDDMSFSIEPGKITAIIGSTGCGKTTLVNLLPRFYDVTQGQITIDGLDVRDLKLHDLRELIGYVPQKGVLFSGDIRDNIKFAGADISDEKMIEAAEIAQAEDFIKENDESYQRHIAQGGSNVSGGQKQRLSIARAIAKEPRIYIFDDSFSALDYKTDNALRSALLPKIKESSVIIVAQRIATVLHADNILVMDEGRLVGEGTHRELMKTCQTYQEIAMSQLSEEELGRGCNDGKID